MAVTEQKLVENSCEPVAGVWKRLFEDDPLGSPDEDIDRSTLVLWTQTPCGIYVDIRLPNGSPGREGFVEKQKNEQTNKTKGTISSLLNMNEDELNEHIDNSQNHQLQEQYQNEHPIKTTYKPHALKARGNNGDDKFGAIEFTEEEWNILMNQKSFAGRLNFSWGDTTSTKGMALAQDSTLNKLAKKYPNSLCTCFWKREIDYQPPTGGLDVGVCCSSVNINLSPKKEQKNSISTKNINNSNKCNAIGNIIRETGDDGSYAEGWMRQEYTEEGPFVALELITENGIPRKGYWVRAGQQFAYAIGRPSTVDDASMLLKNGSTAIDDMKSHLVQHQIGKTLIEAVDFLGTEALADEKQKTFLRNHLVHTYVACHGDILEKYCDGESAWDGGSDGIKIHNLKTNDDIVKTGQNPNMDEKPIASSIWRIHYSTHPGLVGCHLMQQQKSNEEDIETAKRHETLLELLNQGDDDMTRKGNEYDTKRCCSELKLQKEWSIDGTKKEGYDHVPRVGDTVEQHLLPTERSSLQDDSGMNTANNNGDGTETVVRTWRIVELTHPSALML